ncbi:hypothetical protein EKK58_05235 [Candidatus Dependentiae bacterium]|nr:MAG: hypothetical protein EKK58_05235 [Candidatus Dependentiae bacterium]
MADPTIATVNDEPWNQSPAEQRRAALAERRKRYMETAPIFKNFPTPIESALSVGERFRRGIPILARDGTRAQFVYDLSGHTTSPETCECGAKCILSSWTELEYAPKDPVAKKHLREYRVVRDVKLCNRCSNRLQSMPLGERWHADET